MYALILVVGLIGLLVNWVLEMLEQRQLHWHASYREKQA
jgi:ABC-type nitrate/sulfonate/bicarbonate transport system permease component